MSVPAPSSIGFLTELRRICGEGFRRNWLPGLVLQTFALTLLALHAWAPPLRPAFEAVSDWKVRGGWVFAAVSTTLFAGILPWLVFLNRGVIPHGQRLKQGLFFAGYWAVQGVIVNALYTAQARWFGDGTDALTLFKKVLVDQGPFNLLYATPFCMVFYRWKDVGFRWRRLGAGLGLRDWALLYSSIQVSCWVVWIPAVTIVYSLPNDLQFPLFLLVLTFYTLVLRFVVHPAPPSARPSPSRESSEKGRESPVPH